MCEPLGCVIVSQGDVRVVENFGKFERVAFPGLHFVFPCLCQNAKPPLSMRLQQIEVYCETKTKDNVFVNIKIAVQFQIEAYEPSIKNAQYRLQNALSQIESYVFDVVRSSVPKLDLDEVFTSKEEISDGIRHSLSDAMGSFGYKIIASPVTDIDPNAEVKRAMNEINKASLARLARLARLASLARLEVSPDVFAVVAIPFVPHLPDPTLPIHQHHGSHRHRLAQSHLRISSGMILNSINCRFLL